MQVFRTTIEANGKIQIPPQILEQLNFEEGQELEIEVEKKSLHVSLSVAQQRKQAQDFVRRKINRTNSAVDEFIEERRKEALND